MKKIVKILLIIFIFQNCTSNTEKDILIGKWSTANGSWCPLEYEFYQDSVRVNEMCSSFVNSWYIKDSKIYHSNIKSNDSFENRNYVFDYKISDNKDTLFIKSINDSQFKFPLYRIKNSYDYLLKNLRLTIDLPSKNNLKLNEENGIGLDIFVGFRNGKLIAKTNSDKTKDLEDIRYETLAFLASKETELNTTNFQYNLLIDKNIDNVKIDSIKEILKLTGYKRIFRIYTNDQIDYEKTDWKKELKWFGTYE